MSYKTKGLFTPEWYVGAAAEEKIKSLCMGRTLNFPCGRSSFGDVRADLELKVRPDLVVDLLNFSHVFRP